VTGFDISWRKPKKMACAHPQYTLEHPIQTFIQIQMTSLCSPQRATRRGEPSIYSPKCWSGGGAYLGWAPNGSSRNRVFDICIAKRKQSVFFSPGFNQSRKYIPLNCLNEGNFLRSDAIKSSAFWLGEAEKYYHRRPAFKSPFGRWVPFDVLSRTRSIVKIILFRG